MKLSLAIRLTAVVFFAWQTNAHEFIVDSDLLNNHFLVNLNLSDWGKKMQIEGFGIAQALILLLHDKYPNTWENPAVLKERPILFVGDFDGKSLGGWVAAVILSTWGIPCDLYVIQDEAHNKPTPTTQFSKALLKDIMSNTYPNLNFVHQRNFDSILEEESQEIRILLKKLLRNFTATNADTFKNQYTQYKMEKPVEADYCPFSNLTMDNYGLVLDSVTASYHKNSPLKIGEIWANKIFKWAAARNGSILVLNDFPSCWSNGKLELPTRFEQLGIVAAKPAAILHIGAMKPEILKFHEMKSMFNYVLIPKALDDALGYSASKAFCTQFDNHIWPGSLQKITFPVLANSETYLKFPYKNIVINIDDETLKIGDTAATAASSYAKYSANLTAVPCFAMAVAA